jgi:hypothetical protein
MSEWERSKYEPYARTPRFFGHFANGGQPGKLRQMLGVDATVPNRASRRAAHGRGWVPGRLVLHRSSAVAGGPRASVHPRHLRQQP